MGMGDIHMLYWIYLRSSYSYLEIGACIYPSQSGLLISYLNIWPGGNLLDPYSCVLVIPVHINQSYADCYLAWSVSTPLQIVAIPILNICCLYFEHGKAFVRTSAV